MLLVVAIVRLMPGVIIVAVMTVVMVMTPLLAVGLAVT
jgi:hypothetical protein